MPAHHLTAFLGTYRHWEHLPVTGSTADGGVLAFFDLRQPIQQRVDRLTEIIREHGITSLCRVVTAAGSCEQGIHDWQADGPQMKCLACPATQAVPYWGAEINIASAAVA